MSLINKKCEPCEGGIPPLSKDGVEEYKSELDSQWSIELYGSEEDRYGSNRKLTRTIECKDFVAAMKYVNDIADLAEQEGHHPDIHISYDTVTLDITTHAIGGLSENDFILAAKIDTLSK